MRAGVWGLMALIALATVRGDGSQAAEAKDRQEFSEHAVWLTPAVSWDGSLVVFFTGKNAARESAAVAFDQRAQDGKFGSSLMVSPLWDRHPDFETGGDALGDIFRESPVTLDLTRLTYISQGRGHEQAQVELALHPGRRAAWKCLDAAKPQALPAPWILAKPGREAPGPRPDLVWVDPRFAEQGWARVDKFEGKAGRVLWESKDGVNGLFWLSQPATLVSRHGVLAVEGVTAFTLRTLLCSPGVVRIGEKDVEARWEPLGEEEQAEFLRRFGVHANHQASFHLEKGLWVPGS